MAWERVTSRLLKQKSWSRLGSLGVTLTSLPDDINQLFDNLQRQNGIAIDGETRLSYFKNFSRTALGADTLHFKKAEELLLRMNPDIVNKIGSAELKTLMRSKLEQVGSDSSPEIKELFDFEQFASLLCDVIKLQRDYERDHRDTQFLSGFREHFPIEPESTPKQLWDILCMIILLYCSFSVPLSIAFPATTETGITTVQDQVELSFDIIFMLDIGLSFLTAYDNQVCAAHSGLKDAVAYQQKKNAIIRKSDHPALRRPPSAPRRQALPRQPSLPTHQARLFLPPTPSWMLQGITVRDFRAIAANYLRTWFLLDFAGRSRPAREGLLLWGAAPPAGSAVQLGGWPGSLPFDTRAPVCSPG